MGARAVGDQEDMEWWDGRGQAGDRPPGREHRG